MDDAALARVVALAEDVLGELKGRVGKLSVETIAHEDGAAFTAWLEDSAEWFEVMGDSALAHDATRPFVAVVTGSLDRHVPTNPGCDRGENAVKLRLGLQGTVKVRCVRARARVCVYPCVCPCMCPCVCPAVARYARETDAEVGTPLP